MPSDPQPSVPEPFGASTGSPRAGTPGGASGAEGNEDDGVLERDDEQRFCRYAEVVGEGRFKCVYRGFDERDGLDVAWAVINGAAQGLDAGGLAQLAAETQRNTRLRHKNIIRCFKCWRAGSTINLITELFTSGNLRDFVQEHQPLGAVALRNFSKQILEGLDYLHSQEPPVAHGDLRCDKVYVNGHEGTVKLGDLGLVTLLSRRYATPRAPGAAYGTDSAPPRDGAAAPRHTPANDIFAFGLCLLEMHTCAVLDPREAHDTAALMAGVEDSTARALFEATFAQAGERPSAAALLRRFFAPSHRSKASPPRGPPTRTESSRSVGGAPARAEGPAVPTALGTGRSAPGASVGGDHGQQAAAAPSDLAAAGAERNSKVARGAGPAHGASAATEGDDAEAPPPRSPSAAAGGELPAVAARQLKGEDYCFAVRQAEGRENTARTVFLQLKMSTMEQVAGAAAFTRTIEFEHNVEEDSPEEVGSELQEEYRLSDTDRDIVAAIIRESLPNLERRESNGRVE